MIRTCTKPFPVVGRCGLQKKNKNRKVHSKNNEIIVKNVILIHKETLPTIKLSSQFHKIMELICVHIDLQDNKSLSFSFCNLFPIRKNYGN